MTEHVRMATTRTPEPGEMWRHPEGHHLVVTSLTVHAETQEPLVVCRSAARPYSSISYPLAAFIGVEQGAFTLLDAG